VAVVEAANAGEEALAIAISLREAVETPHKTAALITPDRALARRVLAALERWKIAVDDSGGDALADTSPRRFARLAADGPPRGAGGGCRARRAYAGRAPCPRQASARAARRRRRRPRARDRGARKGGPARPAAAPGQRGARARARRVPRRARKTAARRSLRSAS